VRRPRLLAFIVIAQLGAVVLVDRAAPAAAYALAATAVLAGAWLRRVEWCVLAVALVASAAAFGSVLARAESDRALARGERVVDVRVAGRREVAAGRVLELQLAGAALPRRAELFVPAPAEGAPPLAIDHAARGERWRMRLRFRPPHAAVNPGAVDRVRQLARRGIGAQATLVHRELAVRTGRDAGAELARPLEWARRRALAVLSTRGQGGALVAALALGERSGLADARSAFAALGVSHLLALSGLHLGLVLAAAYAAARLVVRRLPARLARDPRAAALLFALAAAVAYATLAGLGVPLRRALTFAFAAALCLRARRPGAARSALWIAASGLIALEPAASFELGAQLSFAATAALVYARRATGSESAPQRAVLRVLVSGLRVSATALAATAPLLGAHGLGASAMGLGANLVLVPWTAAVLLPGALVAAGAAALGTAEPIVSLAVALADGTLGAVRATARTLPGLAPGPAPAAWAIGLAGALALAALRASRTPARVGWVLALVAALRIPGSGDASVPPQAIALDVGSGDALLLRSGGRAVLVDGGLALAGGIDLGRSRVLPALAALGVDELDVVVATHADADHAGGLAAVLDGLPVRELWLPAGQARDPGFAQLLRIARRGGVAWRSVSSASAARSLGPGLRLEPLWPPPELESGPRNATSLVLLARLGDIRLLLTGDLGRAGERALLASGRPLRADVLKLAHHGSATSTHAAWLDAVRPTVAILSAACARRGLPADAVLERLRRRGISLWWTGRDGAVFVGSRPLAVHALAPARRCGSAAHEAGSALLDESALRLARILGLAQGASDLFLARVGLGQGYAQQLANPRARRAHREWSVRGDRVGGLERAREQGVRLDDLVQQAVLERLRGVDRLRSQQQLLGVHPADLSGQQHRGVAGRVEPECNLLEREARVRAGITQLGGEHEVEAPGAGSTVDGADERRCQVEPGQQRRRDVAQALELLVADPLARGQPLRRGNGALHVHSSAEDRACAREHRATDLGVLGDAAPGCGQRGEHGRVEGVCGPRAIQRHECDMRVLGRELEVDGHVTPPVTGAAHGEGEAPSSPCYAGAMASNALQQELPFHLRGNYAPVCDEVTAFDLSVEGALPPELDGLFLRNGPNPRSGTSPHWFAGDGMLHGVRLEAGRALWYRNRYLRTPSFLDPQREVISEQGIDLGAGGPANTHVIEHAGRILALVEVAHPTEVDAELETVGVHDFDGALQTAMTAHPKHCPRTGELHFFGYGFAPPLLTYHVADAAGRLLRSVEIPVAGATMVHDFAITGGHALFLDLPVVFDSEQAMSGGMPYRWSDDYAARIGVLPRGESGARTRWFEIEPCYVFHPVNAYDDGDRIVLDVARYPELWRERSDRFDTASLHRFELDLGGGRVSETALDDREVEFPRVDERRAGQACRYGYAVGHFATESGTSGSLLKYDFGSGTGREHVFGAGRAGSEGVFVPADPGSGEDEGYVLSFVYDAQQDGSELVVLDAQAFERAPLARVRLPQRVPFGFHGSWIDAHALG
jgi:carotenoid cleavage dioxygenase